MESGERAIGMLGRIIGPWSYLTAPVFVGLERIPDDRPAIYVGNHTLMGGLDVPLMMAGLYEAKGIVIHALGDRIHFGASGRRIRRLAIRTDGGGCGSARQIDRSRWGSCSSRPRSLS